MKNKLDFNIWVYLNYYWDILLLKNYISVHTKFFFVYFLNYQYCIKNLQFPVTEGIRNMSSGLICVSRRCDVVDHTYTKTTQNLLINHPSDFLGCVNVRVLGISLCGDTDSTKNIPSFSPSLSLSLSLWDI